MSNSQKNTKANQSVKQQDIDRSLAIFYHPLFQEVTSQWIFALFGKQKAKNSLTYSHPQDFSMNFLEFIEFNLKVQKCLLPQFDLSNAFVSALNDWVKEITECFNYQDLYASNEEEEDDLNNLKKEIEDSGNSLTLPAKEYLQFLDMFKEHEAFKIVKFNITNEVFCKFLFDLCTTWCEFLDIELFIFFLYSVLLQISKGEEGISDSYFSPTLSITNLSQNFFTVFDQLKETYSSCHKKNLRYYRAWCEWNYLRLNDMGESILIKISQVFGTEEEDRIYGLVSIFEKAIDTVNAEISSQVTKTHDNKSENQKVLKPQVVDLQGSSDQEIKLNISSRPSSELLEKGKSKPKTELTSVIPPPHLLLNSNPLQNEGIQQLTQIPSLPAPYYKKQYKDKKELNRLPSTLVFNKPGLEYLQQQKAIPVDPSELPKTVIVKAQYQKNQMKQDEMRRGEINKQSISQFAQNNQQARLAQDLQQFEIDFDTSGNILLKKVVRIPIYGKKIEPIFPSVPSQGTFIDYMQSKKDINYIKPVKPISTAQFQVDSSFLPLDLSSNAPLRSNNIQIQSQNILQFKSRAQSLTKQKQQNSSFNNNNASRDGISNSSQIINGDDQKQSNKYQFIKNSNNPLLSDDESPQKKKEIEFPSQKQEIGPLHMEIFQKDRESNDRSILAPLMEVRVGRKQDIRMSTRKVRSITEDKKDTKSVLTPEFLKEINNQAIEKQLNVISKEEQSTNIYKTELLNEFNINIYQNKRAPQFDLPKKSLIQPALVDEYVLKEKVLKQFEQGQGKVNQLQSFLEPNYQIHYIANNNNANSKNSKSNYIRKLLCSPSKRQFQRDYQFEILQDKNLQQIKEKCIKSEIEKEGYNQNDEREEPTDPNQDKTYIQAVKRYRRIWKKYLSEDDMYKLNDWDSLYKIIILLKRKFVLENRQNYLNFLNLDLGQKGYQGTEDIDDDASTQAEEDSQRQVPRFVPDKEKFKATIQKLIKRDERRKRRRRQRRKAQQSANDVNNTTKNQKLSKFRSSSNKQLFKDVFLKPQMRQSEN